MTRRNPNPPPKAAIENLFAAALALHQSGQTGKAVKAYKKILTLDPDHAGAWHLLGTAALDAGDAKEGLRRIGQAAALRPDYAEAHFDLGRAFRELGQENQALESFERAAALAPDFAEPRQALGLCHLESARPEAALAWFDKALDVSPGNADLWLLKSWALTHLQRPEEAIAACAKAVALDPGHLQARLELAEALLGSARPGQALGALDAARALDPANPWEASLRGQALLASGDACGAEASFRRSLELDPNDPHGVLARLARMGAGPTPAGSSLAWVRRLYEGKARLWDKSMRGEDGYRGPQLLARAIKEPLAGRTGLAVLDAGCGSGLCAPMLRPLAGRLDGVDISPAMLAVAREKGLYDRLAECEITQFLSRSPGEYDLILAAAVLIYFGDLAPALRAAFASLKPDGLLAFTFFPGDVDGYELTPAGHYRHGPGWVEALAATAGFLLAARVEGEHETLDGEAVRGLALALRKPASPQSGR